MSANQSTTFPPDPLLPDATLPDDSTSSDQSLGQTTLPATRPRRYEGKVLWVALLAVLLGIGFAIALWGGEARSPEVPAAPAR